MDSDLQKFLDVCVFLYMQATGKIPEKKSLNTDYLRLVKLREKLGSLCTPIVSVVGKEPRLRIEGLIMAGDGSLVSLDGIRIYDILTGGLVQEYRDFESQEIIDKF